MPKNGELAPVQVTILVQQQASLRTSDKVIRISDNRIISPFAVITERTRKNIKLDGDAAKFLGFLKAQEGLYQLIVVNSAASGRYTLQISLEDSGDVGSSPESPNQKIDVFVENSQSHAHFRKPKYSLEIDANTVENGVKLTHVELEGVPIDEAKIMILDGNPGWVTVEEYGGKVNVGKYDGPIYTGKSSIRIGAVDKKTWTILTETLVEIDVKNGQEPVENEQDSSENLEKSRVLEATFDREKSETFDIQLDDKSLKLDLKSMYGIDEKGRKVPLDPTTIQVTPTHLQIAPESLKSLRLLGLTLKNPKTSETTAILVRLISSPEYLEIQRKLAARPIYPSPWTRDSNEIHVELKEELALGQVVGVYPAVSRQNMSQNSRQIQISGPMKEAFDFDEMTGELKLKQRIDFESLDENQKMFNLTLVSGDEGYRSEAILMVKVLDVDDNAPVVDMGQMEEISLPENLAAGTKIAEFDVTDPDGSDSYKVELEGEGNQNFRAEINSNGTLSIFISEASQIDRETKDAMAILVKISDVSGNSERILLPIRILDVNDNAPEFEEPMYEIEAMEDWPRGVVIHRIHAKDSDDVGPASDVSYRILRNSEDVPDVISVNSTTGVIQVSGDLWGLGREMPYKFEVVAEDSGAPKMNSSSILSLRIRGKGDVITEETVEFLEPKFGGAVVKVKENLPLDTKIFTVKADLRGIPNKTSGKLVYSIKDLLKTEKEPTFAIDKDSGEVFVTREIDYERLKEYTLLITASNSEDERVTSSTILKIHVENLNDNEPRFLENGLPVFQILRNTTKPTAIGRLTAQDPDSDPIFYHLLPNCGSTEISKNFSIDSEFGEISYHPKTTVDSGKFEICFVAASQNDLDTSEVFFDGNKPNFRKVLVDFVDSEIPENSGKLSGLSGNMTISKVGEILDKIEIPILMNSVGTSGEFDLKNLNFAPANYELGRDMISPERAVELNKKTGELVANGRIVDTPQGVYTAEIEKGGSVALKQLHHIRNDRKLRYVLSMSRNEFGANLEKFKRQILEAIEKDDQKAGKQLDIHFDEPKMDRKNSTWTSVCFYLTRENAILDDKQITALISPSNGHISKLHHIFKVQNVDACSPRASTTSSESTAPIDVPLNTVILIGVVGLLIIALIGLLIFVCCVSKYQRYLKQKTERMRSSSSAGSYYKSPNLIPPPPPGYIHTPPLPPPPPPPQAIAYY
ncbi:hypothetical protein L3Y34_005693 [Caenorhabditis briggsae]|uniref:Cadherin domain-containing protein n=1 Tax=Caenorhabditis briggsae TaxID=6238 RepID=A0AAE9D7P7_CAEBR|nr:hypothetical protein L3Y34_005693 [Caenorhabditis briggsae]